MDNANMAEVYRNRMVMTATPAELTLMLYQGAIRFCLEAQKALNEKDIEKANASNIKVQRIMSELANTLDMKQEVSKNWRSLYEYINQRLLESNLHKDPAPLAEALGMIREFKDTWQEVMKRAAAERPPQSLAR